MSKYKDLAERLRGKPPTHSTLDRYEAADAIEAQAKRIEELEASLIICKRAIDNWDMDKLVSSQARKVLGEKK